MDEIRTMANLLTTDSRATNMKMLIKRKRPHIQK